MGAERTSGVYIVANPREENLTIVECDFFPGKENITSGDPQRVPEAKWVHLPILELCFVEYSDGLE